MPPVADADAGEYEYDYKAFGNGPNAGEVGSGMDIGRATQRARASLDHSNVTFTLHTIILSLVVYQGCALRVCKQQGRTRQQTRDTTQCRVRLLTSTHVDAKGRETVHGMVEPASTNVNSINNSFLSLSPVISLQAHLFLSIPST